MSVSRPVSGGWCARCGTMHTPSFGTCKRALPGVDGASPAPSADRLAGSGGYGRSPLLDRLLVRRGRRQDVRRPVLSGRKGGAEWCFAPFPGNSTGCGRWLAGWIRLLTRPLLRSSSVNPSRKSSASVGRWSHCPRGRLAVVGSSLKRRALSRQLMREIHDLYRLKNFRGEELPLTAAFCGDGAPPAGTGDCCGPKLLHHAAE